MLAARNQFLAPGKLRLLEATAGRELPFRLGREVLAGPFGIGLGIAVGDMDDRMIQDRPDAALAPQGGAASWRPA